MVYLAVLGMLISALFLVPTPICGTYCTVTKAGLDNVLPYIGVAYFTAVIFLKSIYKPGLNLILPVGLSFHMVWFLKGIYLGVICPLCIVVLIVNVLLFWVYVREVTSSKYLCGTAAVLVLVTITVVNLLPIPVALSNPETSAATKSSQYKQNDPFIEVYNSAEPVQIDVSQTPVLLWSPYLRCLQGLNETD